jgi:hypothetical protein
MLPGGHAPMRWLLQQSDVVDDDVDAATVDLRKSQLYDRRGEDDDL